MQRRLDEDPGRQELDKKRDTCELVEKPRNQAVLFWKETMSSEETRISEPVGKPGSQTVLLRQEPMSSEETRLQLTSQKQSRQSGQEANRNK